MKTYRIQTHAWTLRTYFVEAASDPSDATRQMREGDAPLVQEEEIEERVTRVEEIADE